MSSMEWEWASLGLILKGIERNNQDQGFQTAGHDSLMRCVKTSVGCEPHVKNWNTIIDQENTRLHSNPAHILSLSIYTHNISTHNIYLYVYENIHRGLIKSIWKLLIYLSSCLPRTIVKPFHPGEAAFSSETPMMWLPFLFPLLSH